MPFLLAEILNFQGLAHLIGVGSLRSLDVIIETSGYDKIGILDIFIRFHFYFTEKPGML